MMEPMGVASEMVTCREGEGRSCERGEGSTLEGRS
jgi:hypothetical protein